MDLVSEPTRSRSRPRQGRWLVVACCTTTVVWAQFDGMQGMGMGSGRRMRDKEPLAVKSDLKYIGCDVCEIVATEIWERVEKKRGEAPMEMVAPRPGAAKVERSSFSEVEVNSVVTDACNRKREAGEWLWFLDLVETKDRGITWRGQPWRELTKKEKQLKGNYLLVETRERDGPIRKWDRESATIRKSCVDLFDDDVDDLDDFIVPLWRQDLKEPKDAKKLLCKDLTSRCSKPRKPLPESGKKREDFRFVEEARNLLETERMMQNMEDQGMPMVMQSREDMMDELLEQLVSEGMTEEEAADFIEATTKQTGGSGGTAEGDDEPDRPDFMDAEL